MPVRCTWKDGQVGSQVHALERTWLPRHDDATVTVTATVTAYGETGHDHGPRVTEDGPRPTWRGERRLSPV
jgi:hypothetical protein